MQLCVTAHRSAWEIVRFLRDGNRMDSVLPHWQEAIRSIQWIDVNRNTHALRGASRFRARSTAFRSLHRRCFPHCWGAWFLHPRVCGRFTDLRSLFRPWYSSAQWSTRPLHRLYGPVDVEESPEIECVEDRVHLVGFTTSSGCMLIRFDRGRWKCHSTVAYSPGSRCHHRSSHQSRWSRQPADQNMLLPHSSASLDSPISDYRRLPCPSPCNGHISNWLL